MDKRSQIKFNFKKFSLSNENKRNKSTVESLTKCYIIDRKRRKISLSQVKNE
jgi:hypothetical protein